MIANGCWWTRRYLANLEPRLPMQLKNLSKLICKEKKIYPADHLSEHFYLSASVHQLSVFLLRVDRRASFKCSFVRISRQFIIRLKRRRCRRRRRRVNLIIDSIKPFKYFSIGFCAHQNTRSTDTRRPAVRPLFGCLSVYV